MIKKIILSTIVIGLIGIVGVLAFSREVPATAVATPVAINTPIIHYVGLYTNGADPATLLIKVGEFVEFDSKDGTSHVIASGKGNDYEQQHEHGGDVYIESDEFGSDEGYKVEFKKIGTYYFHDHKNPNLTITVAVYDPTRE